MDIHTFISDWIATSNSFNTKKYLDFYLADAVLDDPSVGSKFDGHVGIKNYFESYFIEYNTHTEIVKLEISEDQNNAYLEVEFSGSFSEGNIGGTFDITLKDGKIAYIKADLIL